MVKVIEAKDVKWLDPAAVDEVAKARAEALADALGELDGRRLDRPAAHKIGKLFQKRLVGRPALIRNDQIAAVCRTTAHAQVVFAQDHDVIEALPTDRADQPLRMIILPG